MYKYILIIIFFFKIGFASNFSLDQFEIEINSNFLGKEVVLFGNKDKDSDVIFIFEGENKKAKLTTKVKEGFLWINETKELNNQPSFFAIFTSPKKTLNEIFLYSNKYLLHIFSFRRNSAERPSACVAGTHHYHFSVV